MSSYMYDTEKDHVKKLPGPGSSAGPHMQGWCTGVCKPDGVLAPTAASVKISLISNFPKGKTPFYPEPATQSC